jgi:hypothetical protein
MRTREQCLAALDGAVEALSDLPVPGLAEEGRALSALVRSFRSRVVQALPAAMPVEPAPEEKRRPSWAPKHWTADELQRIGLRVPFSPRTFGTVDGRKKSFHTPSCFHVHYDSEYIELEDALESGYKPCEDCGGVRFGLDPLELASLLDELLRYVEEIHRFELWDYSGLIDAYEAARILGTDYDELWKECGREARRQLKGVPGRRYFQIRGGQINVVRYKAAPTATAYCYKFQRPDCMAYVRKLGRMA